LFARFSLFIASGLCLTQPAFGQDARDLEYREVKTSASKDGLQASGRFEAAWYEYNNLDFRALDESSDQSIFDSDDRGEFAFTGLSLELAHRVDDRVNLVVGTSYRGLWGNDQFGNTNPWGGLFYFNAAYVETWLGDKPKKSPRLRIGRQYFEIGGLNRGNDYALADVLDMVRVDLPLGDWGNLIVVPVNVFSATSDHDGANFVSYIGQAAPSTFNFGGDTVTRRHMMVLEATELGAIEARVYAAYSDIGAAAVDPASAGYGTGSDISYGGLLGNFADNDWVANAGVRVTGEWGAVKPWLVLDASTGIDRKELVAQDVNTDGLAWGGGIQFDQRADKTRDGILLTASYYDAMGAGYSDNGLLFSHGYVGLKGRHAGGMIFNRFLGMHPSAYVSRFGVSNRPHEQSRKAGTRELHAAVAANLSGPVSMRLAWWMLQDTGITSLNLNKLDNITPPFGYSRSEFAAQERMGQLLGHEVNAHIGIENGEKMEFFLSGGAVLGSDFYGVEVARVAGSALGSRSPAMPWSAAAGTKVRF
jgi:hypothetical protein